MSDKDKSLKSQNKKFIKISIQNIIQGAIGILIAGILAFMGTTIMNSIEEVDDHQMRLIKLETWKEEALLQALNSLDESMKEFKKETSMTMGALTGEQKKILSSISRIEGILEGMGR